MSDPYDDQAVPYQPEADQRAQSAPPYSATATATQSAYVDSTPPLEPNVPQPQRPSRGLRTGAIFALILLLAVIFGTGLFAGWEFGRGTAIADPAATTTTNPAPTVQVPPLTSNNIQAVREAVIAKVRPAVVEVKVTSQAGAGLGSGVIIDKRGYIVTNYHVVAGSQNIQVVLFDGTTTTAQVVGTDQADDLAVIKITPPATSLTVANIGDSSTLQVGQDVLAIGNPLGITQTVTNGIISALGRNVNEQNGAIIPGAIQTDAPINPGNSGGALVDLQGNLVGIPT
ncbi:MAG TPA: trypsin-like peptidase domain-containing protein, partial [Ktedonobacteraceae bacterium]|nr:trypsin-like peptidase domain-containing protein [Ktedonobacteraceae bacterium]